MYQMLTHLPSQHLEMIIPLLPEEFQRQLLILAYQQLGQLYQQLIQLPDDQQLVIIEQVQQALRKSK